MSTATDVLIKSEIRGHVGLVTLNRPDALNALNHPLMDQLEALLDQWVRDDSLRCVVIAGSERAFAAGADIKEMEGLSPKDWAQDSHLSRWDKIGEFPKPTIAAVSGFALGGGCELALACDMIVASESAQFGQPEIMLGVMPGAGGTVRLARILGKAKTMELNLTGRRVSAQEAQELGFVNKVVPVESFLSEALKLAESVAKMPPLAAQAIKRSILNAYSVDSALKFERDQFYALFATKDQKEGMKAFVDKRKPVWTGK
jgi:enoyl-CoA hydratase